MVEFGLKLIDNKVEEWAHAYINYEELKGLIAAAKKAEKVRDELEARNTSLAAEIKYQIASCSRGSLKSTAGNGDGGDFKFDEMSFATESEVQSLVSFPDEVGSGQNNGELLNNGSNPNLSMISENPVVNSYGSVSQNDSQHVSSQHGSSQHEPSTPRLEKNSNEKPGMTRSLSDASLSSLFQLGENVSKSVSGYLPYFQRHTFENKLKKAIKNENAAIENFRNCLYNEAEKVNELYYRIFDEMNERLEYLIETVDNSHYFSTKKNKRSWKEEVKSKMTTLVPKKLVDISDHMDGVDDSDDEHDLSEGQKKDSKVQAYEAIRESDSIQRAMTDLHRRSKLLRNFAVMNSTGFIKIVKKFDKSLPLRKGSMSEVTKDRYICDDGNGIAALSDRMEKLFAKWFCEGNMTEARSVLLPKKGDGLDMDWSQLRLGYRLGMCSVLALWVAWDCVWGLVQDGHSTIGGRTAFPVFRACGGLLMVHWFWGISVYVWNRFRINYIFLFDFDPRIVQTPVMIFESATDETLVFLVLMLLYYKSGAHDIPDVIPPGGYPFLLVLFTIYRLIFPLKLRLPLWKAIFKVVTAPVSKPDFFHTYVADIFTSMVKVFQDILWAGCFFISGDFLLTERDGLNSQPKNWHNSIWYKNIVIPMICLFPLWIRFNQCLRRYLDTGKRNPNLFNAAKYALSQTVTLFGTFHPLYLLYMEHQEEHDSQDDTLEILAPNADGSLFNVFWMGIFVASSLYSYFWDVRMDWGLGRIENRLLGTRLMFPKAQIYYLVMVVDLFLRFMWVTTLIPPQSGAQFEIPQYLSLATMSMELFRRTIWGFFRLEHEHRHNSQGFRRVDFVPLHFSTESVNKDRKIEHDGWQVLGEVTIVTIIVITISAWSVISAQKATNNMMTEGHSI